MKIQVLKGFGCSFEHYMQDHCWVDGPCRREALLNKAQTGLTECGGRWGGVHEWSGPPVAVLPHHKPDLVWETKHCCLPFHVRVHRNRCLTSKTCNPVFAHHSVVQMPLFWLSVPLSLFVLLRPTRRRQERKTGVCLTSPSPAGFGSDQKCCSFALSCCWDARSYLKWHLWTEGAKINGIRCWSGLWGKTRIQ